jgi:hypothetical protein
VLGWWLLPVGLLSGFAFRYKGLAVPIVLELGWYIERLVTGHFANPTDNVAAEAMLAAVIGAIVGALGVIVGIVLRWLLARSNRGRTAKPDLT